MSSDGTVWWIIGDSGGRVEYHYIIGFEEKMMRE